MFTICPKTLEHWSLASVRSLERNDQYALDRNSLFGKSSTTLASQLLCHPLSLYSAILLALPIEWCEQRFNWRVRQLVRCLLANDQTTKGYFRVPVQRNSENFRSRRRGAQFDLGVLSCYRLSYMWWPRWRIASDYETWIYNTTHLHVLVLVKYADFFALFVLIWAVYLYSVCCLWLSLCLWVWPRVKLKAQLRRGDWRSRSLTLCLFASELCNTLL